MSSRIRELCKDFYGYSTLHGLHFLFDSPWTIRRAIWFLLLLGASCMFFYQAHEAYVKWRRYEVYIMTKFKSERELKFPAVTICNKNMLKKSKIMGKDGQLWLDGQNFKLQKVWSKIHSKINASFDIEKEVLTNGHHAKDIIKEMRVAALCPGTPYNVMTTKSFLDVQAGLCHTIYIKNTVRKLGKSYGLILLLDAEPHEYYGPYSWDGTGFIIMVHDPGIYPVMDYHAIDISTGFQTNLRIRKKKKIHLPEPYPAKCGTKKLKSSNVYSESRCLMEQYADEAGQKCGCRLIGSPVVGETNRRYCNVTEIVTCAFTALYNYNFDSSKCPLNCTHVLYDVQSSSIVYPAKSALDDFSKNDTVFCGVNYDFMNEYNKTRNGDDSYSDWFRGRYARVTVFFSSRDVEITQEMPAFDDLDFAGNLGGNMGLYLGCSVLTLVEFADFLALVAFQWFKKKDHKVSELALANNQEATDKPETT